MKDFLHNYFFNVLISLAILSLGGFMLGQVQSLYYQYSSLDHFYENRDFVAFDICVGDEHQSILSDRLVKGTKVGYQAVVNKELYQIVNGSRVKVYEERTYPFVEVADSGKTQRIQDVPTDLPAGEYEWVLYVVLDIYGTSREVIPPITSNVFTITNCTS